MKHLFISGHRGTRIKAIENTKSAFAYCLQNHIDYIEFDVRKTRDNHLIVFHDKKVNRLLNGSGNTENFTLEELRNLSYKDKQKIQTLEEFFDQIKKQSRPMLEIKSQGIASQIIDTIHQYGYKKDEILVQSFYAREILECYELDHQIDYGLCLFFTAKYFPFQKRKVAKWVYRKFIEPYHVKWLNIDGIFLYNEFCEELANHEIKIILGAQNPEQYLSKIDAWNVEIVNSDDPVSIREILCNKGYKVNKF